MSDIAVIPQAEPFAILESVSIRLMIFTPCNFSVPVRFTAGRQQVGCPTRSGNMAGKSLFLSASRYKHARDSLPE